MKAGRKTADPAVKELAGTFRPDRHGNIVELATPPRDVPRQPAYLTKEARMVWDEELPRVVGCGAVEADSSQFAAYCSLEAIFRCKIALGEEITGAMWTNLRQYRETLGIAGQRSRLAKLASSAPAKATPFSVRPA